MKNNGSHSECDHPRTKAARAACRRARAAQKPVISAFDLAEAYELNNAKRDWDEIFERRCSDDLSDRELRAWDSASQNADDTSVDEGFEPYSLQWYRSFVQTFNYHMDQE